MLQMCLLYYYGKNHDHFCIMKAKLNCSKVYCDRMTNLKWLHMYLHTLFSKYLKIFNYSIGPFLHCIFIKLYQNIPHGSLARTVLANSTGSDDPILLTALMRNLYSFFGVRSSHLNFVGWFGGICAILSHPPIVKKINVYHLRS
jgi:hypothetical protein